MNLILICTWISMASMFSMFSLELLNVDILLMVEKGIRSIICHEIHRYAKTNDNYMNNYDKKKELSYI